MVQCHRKAHVPAICTISHVDREEELHGFLFLCMHVVLYL